ncbi:MAG: FecR domain-containing protein [Calditrichaceae bacterium]
MRFLLFKTVFLLLFLLLNLYGQDDTSAKVKFVIGDVSLMTDGQTNWNAVRINSDVKKGDRIRTKLNSRIEIEMPDGSVIKINENSVFDVTEIRLPENGGENKMSFTLWAGNIWANFKKIIDNRDVREVESPTAVVAVRGTTFEVDVDQSLTTRVRVEEGKVAVKSKDVAEEVMVESNQETVVAKGSAPTRPGAFRRLRQDDQTDNDGFAFNVNLSSFQFVDQAVIGSGVPVSGNLPPGTALTADGIPVNVDPNGNFAGNLRVKEGLNEIRLVAEKDGIKNAKVVKLFVNTKRPEIRLSTPLVAGYYNRRDYSLSGAVFDQTPNDRVKIFLNDDEVAEVRGQGTFNRTIILNEGKNDIRIAAEDLSKNRSEISQRLFLDTVKPIVTLTEPAQQTLVRFEPPMPPLDNLTTAVTERFTQGIRGIITDPQPSSGIKRVVINGMDVKPKSDGSFDVKINLQRGENRLSFYVEDMAGNIARDNSRLVIVR